MQPTQRPTVVLLHSSASSARQWERLVEALAPHFRMRAIEFHGHGERTAWGGDAPLTLADEAALAVPLLEEAGGAHVVGHSYGAAVALKLATMHPKLVRSVVAYEPVLFRWLIDDIAHQQLGQGVVTVADSMRDRLANDWSIRLRSDSSISGPAPARGTHCPAANRVRSPHACVL